MLKSVQGYGHAIMSNMEHVLRGLEQESKTEMKIAPSSEDGLPYSRRKDRLAGL